MKYYDTEEDCAPITQINITPMVDIMLVLLIIFMLTATYIARGAIGVELPRAVSGDAVPQASVAVVVQSDGGIILNGNHVLIEDLGAQVEMIVADSVDPQAVIDGDQHVPYGKIMEIIDLLRLSGVKRFAATVVRERGTL